MVSLLGVGLATSVSAQSSIGGDMQGATETSRWALGLGIASRQRPYTGVQRDNKVVPLLSFENSWVRFAGATADLKLSEKPLMPTQALSAGLRLKYEIDGYEASDSAQLSGMDERKRSFWAGAVVGWRNPVANLSAEWLTDASENSKGHKLMVQVERRFTWSGISLTPRLQAQWVSGKYVDYYFGVRADETRPDRAAYGGKSAITVEAGLRLDYAIDKSNALFLDLSATRLPHEITSSPLVDRRSTSRVALGYLYRF